MSSDIVLYVARAVSDAAKETLKLQCRVAIEPGGKVPTNGYGKDVIGSVIALKSSVFTGSIAVFFPKETYLAVVNQMLGESYQSLPADLEDGVCELLNIIFGVAKTRLTNDGHDVDMAIPIRLSPAHKRDGEDERARCVVIPFQSSHGNFCLELMVRAS